MALFQKKPQTSSSAPLYTLGLNKTVLIVGLGNPGRKYAKTRHNVGFMCLDAFAKAQGFDEWVEKKDLKASITSKSLGNTRVILCKPKTYMNLSGEAAQAVAHFYKVASSDMVVVHDELDIPFGQIRSRTGGSSAGHKGVESLIAHLGNDFGRVRIGINAETEMEGADFVLADFGKDEQASLPALTKEVTAILTEYIYGDQLDTETRRWLV